MKEFIESFPYYVQLSFLIRNPGKVFPNIERERKAT
jgi:hypothetical protein